MSGTIRQLFSPGKQIDRTIEKVIDYYAQDEDRLASEVSEYEITDNIERCFQRFLDVYGEGVRGGKVAETGIWVSGFYGSGKSSFTKYIGAALNPAKKIGNRTFLELLCERFPKKEVPATLTTIAKNYPTTVIMLDLGAEQLSESSVAPVSTVLYWKILQSFNYSKEKKIARLELTLEKQGKYDQFKSEYQRKYKAEWLGIHNDPLIGVARASEIVPKVLPEDFPTPDKFRSLRFEEARDIRDIAREIIDICRRKASHENILFLIDEAGQYVAPRGELILNLDGLARNLKELGTGKVWIVATGQQTLSEIVEKAAHNSQELNKLRDRFPVSIHLDASDIREITHRRLLEKSPDGAKQLASLFKTNGQQLISHTKLSNTTLYKSDPDSDSFTKLYPFLPQHFDLLLELIRTLARSTGGIGLRSAIRVIQDVLIDKSRVLKASSAKLADRDIGTLACIDDFYDTLRADIAKARLPHVVAAVDKIEGIFSAKPLVVRVAKAIAALQSIETFPRTAENIAALLYNRLGGPSILEDVRDALRVLLSEKECGLIEDPQSGGYVYLSDAVKPVREKRNAYVPTSGECIRSRIEILKHGSAEHPLFRTQPSARIENAKDVRATVKFSRATVVGGAEDIDVIIELVSPESWDEKKTDFLVQTNSRTELRNSIVVLVKDKPAIEDLLPEVVKSEKVLGDTDETTADSDVAQFLRAERRAAERDKERIAALTDKAILDGVFVFRGKMRPVLEGGETLEAALRSQLAEAAGTIFSQFHLAAIRPTTDAAARFLAVDRIDRITREHDPLALVSRTRGAPRVDMTLPVLAETIRLFKLRAADSGSGRLQGSAIQDIFSAPPYGWTKDTVRYLFSALLRAGEIEFHIPGVSGPVRTPGPQSIEAVKSTVAFNRIGISLRDVRLPPDALDRAAKRMEQLWGEEVLPLEDHISRAVRTRIPDLIEKIGTLPDRLRLLGLQGSERSLDLLRNCNDMLKGDAGSAATVLGGGECSLPDEIVWARSVSEALEGGAEEDITATRSMIAELDTLHRLFPGCCNELCPVQDRDAISEVIGSDRFHEKLPVLRETVRRISDRAMARYGKELKDYHAACKAGLGMIESDPNWLLITDEDREEIAARLGTTLDKEPAQPLSGLQTIMMHSRTLAGLLQELKQEIAGRIPPAPPHTETVEEPNDETLEELLTPETLMQPALLRTSDDIDKWLVSIRRRLIDIIKTRRAIRIKGVQ